MAHFCTSFADYQKHLGELLPGERGLLGHAVNGFFAAGGKRAYVVRVLPSNAVKGQSSPVPSRIGGAPPPSSLQFVARGAGIWSTNLRIFIGASTNFLADAFRVDVKWSDNGAIKPLETFDDVRMDPTHEDYVVERMKSSKYVEAVDLFQAALNVPAPPTLIGAQLPALRTKTVANAADVIAIPVGKKFTVSSWDVGLPDVPAVTEVVEFTKANVDSALNPTVLVAANGFYNMTMAQIGAVFDEELSTAFRVAVPSNTSVVIDDAQSTPPTVNVTAPTPPTYDLTGQQLVVTINGVASPPIAVPAAAAATTTSAEIAAALTGAGLGLSVSLGANGAFTVTGVGNASAVPTLAIASTPTAARITTAAGVAGAQGPVISVDRYDYKRLSITEVVTALAPAVLVKNLGFTTVARGYGANSPNNPLVRPTATTASTPVLVAGGTDGSGAITSSDYAGTIIDRTGVHALDGLDVNIVALPGKNDFAHIAVNVAYCDSRGDCFALIDGPGTVERNVEIKPDEARLFIDSLPSRSKNAAMFYPWIQVPDPTGIGRNPTRFVAPSGHVAGIFARTDITRGVWKAPAGIEATVPQAVGLQARVLDSDQDLLNPASLNCLRQFPGVGIVSWGSRTLAPDPEWRYVPVRRMALFLKESLRRGLQWAVFEPNDEELWGRIRINIEAFMMTLFRQGAFQGATPDEAFLVQCDRATNPQENVDAGIVTAKVAFAPLKPAEFVVIEISQKSLLAS
ncbi:MAG: phage tail sheath subtilisin-like domain-containing protein [Deltaproteobacteria bacterium]|nr:phage tail sheath subtilisin-like domain-containing protein [Kofleriaceae bacterium]